MSFRKLESIGYLQTSILCKHSYNNKNKKRRQPLKTNNEPLGSKTTKTKSANNAISYTITYNLDGGEVATINPTTYGEASETFVLNEPTNLLVAFLKLATLIFILSAACYIERIPSSIKLNNN